VETAVPTTRSSRPRRIDAQRNHERIVAAARSVLAESGADARVEDIAHRAGVGIGTLYRHFPDKDALTDAVLDDAFGEIVALAEAALEEPDAWEAFAGFLRRTIALHATNSGLRGIAAGSERGRERAAEMRTRLRPLVRTLVERAQAEGGLRADFTPEDVPLVFWGTGKVIDLSATVAPVLWQRFLGLLLDGLRTGSASPLATPPLTRRQLDRVTARRTS
jgi:AcrR family transcriptional regulator